MVFGHVFAELAAYAEGQLDPTVAARVEAHLASCGDCRALLEEIRRGITLAAALAPVPMPDEVRDTIRRRLAAGDVGAVPPRGAGAWWRAAAVLAVVLVGTAVYWEVNRPWIRLSAAVAAPTPFEHEGRRLHDAIGAGRLPLAFVSDDDRALWQWLESQRAPVTAIEIARRDGPGPRIVPVGATVQSLGGVRTSVLSYRIDGHPVTLALASAHDVAERPAAGWWSKRVLHRRDASGANTLTWTVGGGTYVLVAELDGAGQQACRLCHTSPRFIAALEKLR